MMTKKEARLFNAYMDASGPAPKEMAAFLAAERRNRAQRARRVSPEAKAREAAASRVSYWRKRYHDAPLCSDAETKAYHRPCAARAELGR